jgi:hypothetical protein
VSLQCLPLVRPINEVDVARLQNKFIMGYRDDDCAIYVSPYNNLDEVLLVSDDIGASWSSLWQECSNEFDSILEKDSDLSQFIGKMFFVLGGESSLDSLV